MNKKCQNGGGIYQIVNTKTGKKYVGGTTNLNTRRSSHKSALKKNKHQNTNLQNDWNKYGESCFSFDVLESAPQDFEQEDIFELEQKYLDTIINWGFDYNISIDARSAWGGRHLPEEVKGKLSEAFSGDKNPMFGKTHTSEAKQKIRDRISERTVFHTWSPEERREISERQKGNKSYWWGRSRKLETKKKISINTRGENNAASKKTEAEVLEIRELYATGKYTYKKLANMYSISIASAWRIVNKITWKHI